MPCDIAETVMNCIECKSLILVGDCYYQYTLAGQVLCEECQPCDCEECREAA
jgi:hypothetical protein